MWWFKTITFIYRSGPLDFTVKLTKRPIYKLLWATSRPTLDKDSIQKLT